MTLAFLQVPAPPLPVGAPGEAIAIAVVATVTITAAFFLLRPLVRSLARRIEGRGALTELSDELDHVRERLEEVDQLQQRVAELEERADFAERLLSQPRPEALPGRSAEETPR